MIIVRLSGGLGNQLFQYAFARRIKEHTKEKVKLDKTSFTPSLQHAVTQREFLLDHFAVTLPTTNALENTVRKIKTGLLKTMAVVRDTTPFVFDPSVLERASDAYLVGNWVNDKYFSSIREVLLKEFTPKAPLSETAARLLEEELSSESVSVHVRRGDYLQYQNKFVQLGETYYREAVRMIRERVARPKFFIFSDDIAYVQTNFKELFGTGTVYVSAYNLSDPEELFIMSGCKHNILANSTFSWWGAWLNRNARATIIAPKKYRVDSADDSDVIPSDRGWLSIEPPPAS